MIYSCDSGKCLTKDQSKTLLRLLARCISRLKVLLIVNTSLFSIIEISEIAI